MFNEETGLVAVIRGMEPAKMAKIAKALVAGGINLDNAADFIKAGAVALGVGGSLLDKEIIANEDYEALTGRARAFQKIVKEAREG